MAGPFCRPEHCWSLERVPRELEMPDYLLQPDQALLGIGRKRQTNTKVCDGPNVSKNHCKLHRCLSYI